MTQKDCRKAGQNIVNGEKGGEFLILIHLQFIFNSNWKEELCWGGKKKKQKTQPASYHF
jgi:hypothetical protein